VAERGGVRCLVFECLAERTIALAQQARMRDPAQDILVQGSGWELA
jgi:hypothetical protein